LMLHTFQNHFEVIVEEMIISLLLEANRSDSANESTVLPQIRGS
jgi:hypothetical protein